MTAYQMKDVLITGSQGFIGSRLKERLQDSNLDVYTLDISGSGERHFQISITEFERFDEFETIFHFAGMSNPRKCSSKKGKAWRVNVEGTRNLLDQLEEDQKILFASSTHVYGDKSQKVKEDNRREPEDFYGLTKEICERLIEHYYQDRGFEYRILRLFNTFGPGQREGFLVPDVIRKAKENDSVEAINPNTKISPVFIEDVIDVMTMNIPAGTYNVANECVKVGRIYEVICDILGTDLVLPEDCAEGSNNCGCGRKIKQYKESWVEIEEGLARTIKDYSA